MSDDIKSEMDKVIEDLEKQGIGREDYHDPDRGG